MGERAAIKSLRKKAYYILESNWRCPVGEIDIIARKKESLIFLEVKTRNTAHSDLFDPLDAVNEKKREQLRRLASWYIHAEQKILKSRRVREFRFDVITLLYDLNFFKKFRVRELNHFEDIC